MPLKTVTQLVKDSWTLAVDEGAMSTQTRDKLVLMATRFERFAAAHGIAAAADVDRDLVHRFITARGRTRRGEIAPSATATMQHRRSAIRALYRTARTIGLLLDDPTDGIELPGRDPSTQRPVTTEEAEIIRLFSQHSHPTRHAVTAALLLAGAHTAELGHIAVDDIDLDERKVRAHGSSKHRCRRLPLDTWAVQVIGERMRFLNSSLPRRDGPVVLCTSAEGSDAHKQARVCVTVREILTRAGLSEDPTIRPSSLTAYAARQAFDRTGLVEAAAIVLGAHSLDTTATLIGYRWR
jgi:integrase/recombinase XerC